MDVQNSERSGRQLLMSDEDHQLDQVGIRTYVVYLPIYLPTRTYMYHLRKYRIADSRSLYRIMWWVLILFSSIT